MCTIGGKKMIFFYRRGDTYTFAEAKIFLAITMFILSLLVSGCVHNELFFEGQGEKWSAKVHVIEQSRGYQLTVIASYNEDLSNLKDLKILSIGFEWLHKDAAYGIGVDTVIFQGSEGQPLNVSIRKSESIDYSSGLPTDNKYQNSFFIGEHFDIANAANKIKIIIEWERQQDIFYVAKQE